MNHRKSSIMIEYHRLRNRLLFLFLVAVTAVLGLVFFLNARQETFIKANSDLAHIINIAGRQRMLSQSIAKTSLSLLSSGASLSAEKKTLDSLISVFTNAHNLLLEKNRELATQGMHTEAIDLLFTKMGDRFDALVRAANYVKLADSLQPTKVRQLLQEERAFLPLMNQVTTKYEEAANDAFQQINRNIRLSNYLVASAVGLAVVVVLLVILRAMRGYASDLAKASSDLEASAEAERVRAEKLEFLTSSIRVGIFEKSLVDGTESWSDTLYTQLGYEKGQITPNEESFLGIVHPADLARLQQTSDESIKTGQSGTTEIRVKTSSGEYKWVEITGTTRRNNNGEIVLLIGGIIDINDRKVLEMQMKAFIERAPAAIAMFDKDLKFVAVSQKWSEQYKLAGSDAIGRNLYEVLPDIEDHWKKIHQECLQGAIRKKDEDPFDRGNGLVQWLKWEIRPWYLDEETIGGILMFTEDVTSARLKNEELRRAKEEAEEASKAKEQFLATMSHEIRTPLNAINGISHILLLEDPRPDQLDHLNLLKFSGENLLSLVNDILDITKIEAGKLVLDFAPFDLYYLVNSIKHSLAYRAKENLVDIIVNYDSALPHTFVSDDTRLTQVLYNLAGNALKFTEQGEVTIAVKMLEKDQDKFRLRISVADTGIGITEQQQQRIFDAFNQADEGTTRKYGGTGLGLYITRKILQIMGSDIRLQSEPGKGSEFSFELSLREAVVDKQIGSKSDSFKSSLWDKDVKVLIAEDNTANQVLAKQLLGHVGVATDIAENGKQAVEALKKKCYDLVLMDLQMPVMDGIEATIKIRSEADTYFKNIPIIALTADAFSSVRDKTLAIGMTDYLTKPFRPNDLFAMVSKHLGKVTKTSE